MVDISDPDTVREPGRSGVETDEPQPSTSRESPSTIPASPSTSRASPFSEGIKRQTTIEDTHPRVKSFKRHPRVKSFKRKFYKNVDYCA